MIHDYGATLAYSTTDGGYTTLARIVTMGEAKNSVKEIPLNILANITQKFGAGTITPGDIPVEVQLHKTDFTTILGIAEARTTYWWKMTDVDGNIWKGRAFIKEYTKIPKFGDDDRLKWSFVLKPSDADWTFTAV